LLIVLSLLIYTPKPIPIQALQRDRLPFQTLIITFTDLLVTFSWFPSASPPLQSSRLYSPTYTLSPEGNMIFPSPSLALLLALPALSLSSLVSAAAVASSSITPYHDYRRAVRSTPCLLLSDLLSTTRAELVPHTFARSTALLFSLLRSRGPGRLVHRHHDRPSLQIRQFLLILRLGLLLS
jgi:hypothetical protein